MNRLNKRTAKKSRYMKKLLPSLVISAVVVSVAASSALAQCAFQHPGKASSIQAAIVPIFVNCSYSDHAPDWQSKTCVGGSNERALCGVASECPGGTCWDRSFEVCIGGSNHLGACTGDPDCSGGGVCRLPSDPFNAPPANKVDEAGIPGCSPQTLNQAAGSPPDGWLWDPSKSAGKLQLKAAKNKVAGVNNPPTNTADMTISLSMTGIRDSMGNANSTGKLSLTLRLTMEDRGQGDMTLTTIPDENEIPFLPDLVTAWAARAVDGKIKLKTSMNVMLVDAALPGLPGCSVIELLSARILDVNGTPFGRIGLFLPDLP